MKKSILPLLLAVAMFSCESTTSVSTSVDERQAVKAPVSNWRYSEDVDKMEGTTTNYAYSTSTNEIEFEFPYNGGSTMDIILRNKGKSDEVLLRVTKGQFMMGIGGSESVKLKFDDEAPIKVSFSSSANGDTEVIFLGQSKKIIEKLKTATKVMVQAPFYQEAGVVFEFDVSGLDWNH